MPFIATNGSGLGSRNTKPKFTYEPWALLVFHYVNKIDDSNDAAANRYERLPLFAVWLI
jgi:hypothetical protein